MQCFDFLEIGSCIWGLLTKLASMHPQPSWVLDYDIEAFMLLVDTNLYSLSKIQSISNGYWVGSYGYMKINTILKFYSAIKGIDFQV